MTRRPLSVCIITKDEERNLPRCLDSVPFADEVVVLDCGSTDATQEIARASGAKLFVEEFRGHVQQKRRAVELAAGPWVLALDADEEVSPELAAAIEAALDGPEDRAAYRVARKTWSLGGFVERGGWWPEWRVRLFDSRRAGWEGRDPHDRVEVREGGVGELAGPLYHYNYRDLRHHLDKVNSYTSIMARELQEAGERFRLRDVLLRPPARFLKMFVLRQGFREGLRGFALAVIAAFYVFLKYLKLWERERGLHGTQSPPEEAASEDDGAGSR